MSAERAVQQPLRPRDIGRLNAFTDGIIVVSMTLLVLDIRLPEHLSNHDGAELVHALVELWPKFFGYALSFLVIAQYWLGYTEEFGDMEAADSTFARLNILLLLFIVGLSLRHQVPSQGGRWRARFLWAALVVLIGSAVALLAMPAG